VVTRRVLLVASITMPQLFSKVAASNPDFSLISDFTKDTFKSVVVVTLSNSANKVLPYKTGERPCSCVTVSGSEQFDFSLLLAE
jgi:hypothetical protein